MCRLTNQNWFSNDELFRKELETGHKWAALVVSRLNDNDIPAELTPLMWRNNIDARHEFSDETDIIVPTPSGVLQLESKSRNLHFTDVPVSYPYDTALVDTVSGWNKKIDKPFAVVLTSQETSEMLVIPSRTNANWTTKLSYDRVRQIQDRWYEVKWDKMLPFDVLVTAIQKRLVTPRF